MGRRVFWEIDAAGIIEVPDAGDAGSGLLSFDLHDHRQACAAPRSARSGRQAFMREWGEQVALLERSASLHAQYGRDPRHLVARPAGCGLIPGLQLIDLLATRHGLPLAGAVVGLRFGVEAPAGRRLVLLFGFDGAGALLRMQEAANPPSLAYLLDDFCRDTAIQVSPERVVWFDQHDALAVLDQLLPYPEEDTLFGQPVGVWWRRAERALASATALAACSAGLLAWQDWSLGESIAASVRAGDASRAQVQAMLQSAPLALARASSAAFGEVFADAEALWQVGTRVRVSSRPGTTDFTLLLDHTPPAAVAGVPGLGDLPHSGPPLAAALARRHDTPLPAGLLALDPATPGDLHAFYLRFRRQTPLSALGAFAGAGV